MQFGNQSFIVYFKSESAKVLKYLHSSFMF